MSVEPCGDETGVRPPEPRTANKASFVSGTSASVAKSARVPKGLWKGSVGSLELFVASSVLLEPAPRCSFARARSWKRPESFSKRSFRRRTRPERCSCIRASCCCGEQDASAFSKHFISLSFLGRAEEPCASVSFCLKSPSPLASSIRVRLSVSLSRDLLSGLSLCPKGIALASRHESEANLPPLAIMGKLAQGGV